MTHPIVRKIPTWLRKNAGSLCIFLAAVGSTQPAFAQSAEEYTIVGNWTITQNFASEAAGSNSSSCSAHLGNAVIQGTAYDALRIERLSAPEVGDVYVFGINGGDRDSSGNYSELHYWFGNDRNNEMGGEAAFAKDPYYEFDDWLSHFEATDIEDNAVEQMRDGGTVSFAVNVPGNRSGNDEVITIFDLTGADEALTALDRCYHVVMAEENDGPADSEDAAIAAAEAAGTSTESTDDEFDDESYEVCDETTDCEPADAPDPETGEYNWPNGYFN